MNKHYISAHALLEDSFRLAAMILRSGYRPDCIIGIWRGGTPVGIAVQEYLAYRGMNTRHFAIATSSYTGIGQQEAEVKVIGLQQIADGAAADDRLLLVDDVFDSGRSMKAVVDRIHEQSPGEAGQTVRIACPWYKPARNRTGIRPDFFLYETDDWLVFPHELVGLTAAEIRNGKGDLADIIDSLELG